MGDSIMVLGEICIVIVALELIAVISFAWFIRKSKNPYEGF